MWALCIYYIRFYDGLYKWKERICSNLTLIPARARNHFSLIWRYHLSISIRCQPCKSNSTITLFPNPSVRWFQDFSSYQLCFLYRQVLAKVTHVTNWWHFLQITDSHIDICNIDNITTSIIIYLSVYTHDENASTIHHLCQRLSYVIHWYLRVK